MDTLPTMTLCPTTASYFAERFRILHEVDQAILGARSPGAIANGALTRLCRLIPCWRATVLVWDRGESRVLAAVARPNATGDVAAWQDLVQISVLEQPYVQGAVDLAAMPHPSPLQSQLLATGVRAYLLVPLLAQGQAIGALVFEAGQPETLTTEHVDTAVEVGSLLALAIQQAELRASLQRELTERLEAQAALQSREAALRGYATELEAQNAELDAFAHTVAHDLKNPLAVIAGYAQLLADSQADMPVAQVTECVAEIDRHTRRMRRIVDSLLLLAGVRRAQDIVIEPLDMQAIVREVIHRLHPELGACQAQITLPGAWLPALGYTPWVEEVWANYISNGCKYGGRPPRLELGADPVAAGEAVRFWIRDSGPGLSVDEQERLFIPFSRGGQLHVPGHGLGLSIVQRIVRRLGGQAGVESKPGRGSLFYFTLPAVVGAAGAETDDTLRVTTPLA